MQEFGGDGGAEIDLAFGDGADGVHDGFLGFLLHDVALGAGLEGAFCVEGFIVHGDDQDRQVLPAIADLFAQFQAVAAVEGEIDEDDIGLGGGQQADGVGRAIRLRRT